MEITVTQKRENALLDREEVLFTVSHPGTGTPSRSEIKKALAGTLNAKGVVVLDWARSEFGRTSTHGYAKVYKSKERALAVETPPILIRNGLLAAAKKEAKPEAPAEAAAPPKKEAKAEAPKAEKPAKEERPKEEAKAPAKEEKKEAPKPAEKKEAKPAAKEEKKAEAPKEKKEAKPAAKKEAK